MLMLQGWAPQCKHSDPFACPSSVTLTLDLCWGGGGSDASDPLSGASINVLCLDFDGDIIAIVGGGGGHGKAEEERAIE